MLYTLYIYCIKVSYPSPGHPPVESRWSDVSGSRDLGAALPRGDSGAIPGKPMGKPCENDGKMMVLWDFLGFTLGFYGIFMGFYGKIWSFSLFLYF